MKNKSVLVAISGGVDSAFTVHLLKSQGYNVHGLFAIFFECESNKRNIANIQRLADKLEIKFDVLDLTKEFNDVVINNFVDEYRAGNTPVPCALCNRHFKFGRLMQFAEENDFDFLATGHYIKLVHGTKENEIHRPLDFTKDQTHFLSMINKKHLPKLMFPLGNMTKKQTMQQAEELGLIDTKSYVESNDICFLNDRKYSDFIKDRGHQFNSGDIIHCNTGKTLGTHRGTIMYTIGQRKGIGVAYSEPLFVTGFDTEQNILYVGEEYHLMSKEFIVKDMNFLSDELYTMETIHASVCTRALKEQTPATICKQEDGCYKIHASNGIKAVTKGQICAIYDGTRLLGGGIISDTLTD